MAAVKDNPAARRWYVENSPHSHWRQRVAERRAAAARLRARRKQFQIFLLQHTSASLLAIGAIYTAGQVFQEGFGAYFSLMTSESSTIWANFSGVELLPLEILILLGATSWGSFKLWPELANWRPRQLVFWFEYWRLKA